MPERVYAGGLSALFGARHIDLNVSSAATKTARHYETARQLNEDTMNARIWLGIHFRRAMTDGNQLGQDVAGSCSATRSSRRAAAIATTGDRGLAARGGAS